MRNLLSESKEGLSDNGEDIRKCNIFSSFGFYVQITLAVLSFLILICNTLFKFSKKISRRA